MGSSRCGKGAVRLAAKGSAGTLSWYTAATGGKSLAKGASFTTPAISSTTTYYVAANDGGCISKRAAVIATVSVLPAKPVIHASGATELCEGQSIQLSVTTAAPSVHWSTGGTNSAITANRANEFTVTVSDANGCSASSAPVKVVVNPYPGILSITPGFRCGHGQNLLGAKASAGMVRWHANDKDTATISYGTLYFTPTFIVARTDTFYVDASYRGCISKRIAVPSVVKPPLDATTTVSGATITANQAAATYQWVDCNNGNIYISGETRQSFTPLSKGDYAVIVTDNTCSETSSCISMQTTVAEAASTRRILYMFPNQGKDRFTVLSNVEGSYTILDKKGKAIRTVQLNNANNFTASNETISNGRYYVVGENNNPADRQKLIVSK